MKLLIIGCGQCGSRIAERFATLAKKARTERRIKIIASAIVVSTDSTDFDNLPSTEDGALKKVVLGDGAFPAHIREETNNLAADMARDEAAKVIEVVEPVMRTGEVDAFLLLAAAGGSTGSGLMPALTMALKRHFPAPPAYNLVVLPFAKEEAERPTCVYNAGTCLKSSYLAADAVFLVDNQKYSTEGPSQRETLDRINATTVAPFYNLLCAGEEKSPANIGGKTLDAGDIIQSLTGWTVIGRGTDRKEPRPPIIPALGSEDKHPVDSQLAVVEKGISLVSEALDELSLECNPQDATRALYLLAAPPETMRISLLKEIGSSLKRAAPQAIIRGGDYPRRGRPMELSLILSGLGDVTRVTALFNKAIGYIKGETLGHKRKTSSEKPDEEAFGRIPLLL